ncbi:MAG: hypothetical protein KY397_00185 [Gemmatimonadetes bacterium]|nr:hypothetical protein [Gemmatimonadota bacterium]
MRLGRFAVGFLVVAALCTSCGPASPVAAEDPEEPDEPELFFDRLPAPRAEGDSRRG